MDLVRYPGEGSIFDLDREVKSFITSSEGDHIQPLRSFKKHDKGPAHEQQKLSRKPKEFIADAGGKMRQKSGLNEVILDQGWWNVVLAFDGKSAMTFDLSAVNVSAQKSPFSEARTRL